MRFPLPSWFVAGAVLFRSAIPGSAATGSIVINEIHYAPADKSSPTEFVELYNPGDEPVDISGWEMDGVGFKMPDHTLIAGKSFLCIVQDPAAFKAAFGVPGIGPWSGKLKNGGERLQLIDTDGRLIDYVEYGSSHPWPAQSRKGGKSLELINARLDRSNPGSWRAGGPTPGKPNSVAAENASPAIADVLHEPAQPQSGDQIRVTAKLSDPQGVRAASLAYQIVEPGAYIRLSDPAYEKEWSILEMRDDGMQGDANAGDGIYSAILPADVAKHRRLIRYRILATDSEGLAGRAPLEGEPVPNFAIFVYDGVPAWTGSAEPGKSQPVTFTSPFLGTLPTLHLLAAEKDVERSQWNGEYNHRECKGTLILDGAVYDHINFHNRGRASTYNTGKNKWGFSLPRGQKLAMKDPTGREIRKKWDGFAMNACASPWVPAHRGMAGLDEWISSRIYELAGVPTPKHIPLHFRIIDTVEEAPAANQYGGDLQGLYMAIENPEGDFLEERDLSDGNIYTNESGEKSHQAPDQPKDRSDLDEFMEGVRAGKDKLWWETRFNLSAFYSFRAASHLTGNVDLREGANHYLYHAPRSQDEGGWTPIPWDLDMMFIPRTHQSGRIDQERCLEHEAFRIEYGNRCRELLDLLLADATPSGGQVGQLIAEYERLMTPAGPAMSWPELDRAMWNFHPRTNDKGGFYRNPVADDRFGGPWERRLKSPDFAGMCSFVLEYLTNCRPADKPWKLNDGDPRGYGFGYLQHDAQDGAAPERPSLAYAGQSGFPANALKFKCSPFADPQGAGTFAGMQVRLGRIHAPGVPGWSPGERFSYEAEELWTSEVMPAFAEEVIVPPHVAWTGSKYRARVRMKDSSGRWSRWSEPVEFVAGPAVR